MQQASCPMLNKGETIMFYTCLLRFIRNPVKMGGILILWFCMFYYFGTTTIYWNEVNKAIDLLMMVLPYLFLVFIIVSYECFYDIKRYQIEEMLDVESGKVLRVQSYDLLLLLLLDLITSISVFAFHLFCYQQAGVLNMALIKYTARVILIYVFLMILVGICIGWVISCIQNRLYGLTLIATAFYLFDKSFISLFTGMSKTNHFTWTLGTLFSMFFQSRRGICRDADYLLSAENVHIYRVLFFICLFTAIILLYRARHRWMSLIPAVFSIIMLVLFFQPTGAVYFFMNIANYQDSVFYIEHYKEDDVAEINRQKCAANRNDFQIQHYDMDITITDQFKASITVVPDVTDLKEYQFTLHFLFHVNGVRDEQGNPLPYEQEEDYLLIHNDSGNIQSITISYSGTTSYFYATTQGLILPANYKYFPVAGWQRTFVDQDEEEESGLLRFFKERDGTGEPMIAETNFARELLPEKAEFDVRLHVRGNYPVESNLTVRKLDRQHGYTDWQIQGNSDGMTLIGNPYLISEEIDGVKIVCSSLDQENVPSGENREKYHEYFETLKKEAGYSPAGKTFIVSPDCNYVNWCYGVDHTLSTILGASKEIDYRRDGILYSYIGKKESEINWDELQ